MSSKRRNKLRVQQAKLAVLNEMRAYKLSGVPLRDPALMQLFGVSGTTSSGEFIDGHNAKNVIVYYSACNLLSSTLGNFPVSLAVRASTPKRDEKALLDLCAEHTNNSLFDNINPYWTWDDFAEFIVHSALTWGYGIALIDRLNKSDPESMVTNMWPMMPWEIIPGYNEAGDKVYRMKHEGRFVDFHEHQVFVINNFGYDGWRGMSCAEVGKDALGLAKTTERYGASFFGNLVSRQADNSDIIPLHLPVDHGGIHHQDPARFDHVLIFIQGRQVHGQHCSRIHDKR